MRKLLFTLLFTACLSLGDTPPTEPPSGDPLLPPDNCVIVCTYDEATKQYILVLECK
jgi:hypothetical protein